MKPCIRMISRDKLRKVISQWILMDVPETISREIVLPMDLSLIISITGPRRAGKTFLMYDTIRKLLHHIGRNNILYVNFENESLSGLSADSMDDIIAEFRDMASPDDTFPIYLFLDEIQVVPQWSKWLNRIYESKKFRIFISGSSSKLLSMEISTELRGRTIDFTVLPLSFKEFLSVKNISTPNLEAMIYSESRGNVLRGLRSYLQKGGYPEITLMPEFQEKLLRSYLDTTILKDVGERFKIEPSILRTFVTYSINSYTKQISGTKIYNYLKSLNYNVAHDFPLKLLDYFSQVFFTFTSTILTPSFKKSLQYPRKLYLVDTGIVNEIRNTFEIGKNMENTVFLQLYRIASEKGIQINYWKEYGKSEGMEVDFVLSKNDQIIQLINVTYASTPEEINPRETRSLMKASTELKCHNLTIITWDYFDQGDINYFPLWYWLLKSSDLI